MSLDCFGERPGISRTISSVLQPVAGYNCYDMIIGYHGTGKTTLVRHVSHEVGGIIDVDILPGATSEERFANVFGAPLKWTTPHHHWVAVMLGKIGLTQEDIHGKNPF